LRLSPRNSESGRSDWIRTSDPLRPRQYSYGRQKQRLQHFSKTGEEFSGRPRRQADELSRVTAWASRHCCHKSRALSHLRIWLKRVRLPSGPPISPGPFRTHRGVDAHPASSTAARVTGRALSCHRSPAREPRLQSTARATSVHPAIQPRAPRNSRLKTPMPSLPRGSKRACSAFMKNAKSV